MVVKLIFWIIRKIEKRKNKIYVKINYNHTYSGGKNYSFLNYSLYRFLTHEELDLLQNTTLILCYPSIQTPNEFLQDKKIQNEVKNEQN